MTEFNFQILYFRKNSSPGQLRKVRKKDLGIHKVVKNESGDGWNSYLCDNGIEVVITNEGVCCHKDYWLILSTDDVILKDGNTIVYKNQEEFNFTI